MARRPTPPGVLLREFYLEPRKLSISRFADACGLSRKHVSNIVHGRVSITPETAVRIAKVLGTSANMWLNLQNAIDLFDADRKLARWKPKRIVPAGTSEAA